MTEVVMDDAVNTTTEDVVHDVDQPQDASKQKKDKTAKYNWFTQPPRPPTLDPEWNTVQVVDDAPEEHWFNDLLRRKKKYTTSITKTKTARYKIVGIKYMVPKLWSATKVGYDKDVEKGIKYWGPKRQLCMKVKILYGYGYLEEIVVTRADRQKYTFKEGDFVNLHLNDIEDMLLLAVQHKLFQLDGSDIVDFTVALRMTLKTVRDKIHHRQLNFYLGYNIGMPRRKWFAMDKRRTGLMVELIDKQLLEMRIIRNLERLVGSRKLEMDYRMMT
ncbi:hypothetical protein Tco_0732197 [Tanacetum coccineum]